MKRALLLMSGLLACTNLAAVSLSPNSLSPNSLSPNSLSPNSLSPKPAKAPAQVDSPAAPGEPVSSVNLYELVFQSVDGPRSPSGTSITLDGRVLGSWPDGTWRVAFTLDPKQLADVRAVLDNTDLAALRQTTPPEDGRSHPPPTAELRFIRQGTPVVVRVPGYTTQGAPAIEALGKQIDAVWAGAPSSGLLRFGSQDVRIDCDPTAVVSLRDVLFPLLDRKLPDAAPSAEAALLSVEWWQGGTFIQRYSLYPGGRVSRVVPGRDHTWKQLGDASRSAVENALGHLTAEGLRAGCP